ncbi:MAG: hypothetical protein KAI71_04950 [Candidatus Pacebacteria bacterium]|nr:hypothetical protein [Candidatus Paceibacterota bacterium]
MALIKIIVINNIKKCSDTFLTLITIFMLFSFLIILNGFKRILVISINNSDGTSNINDIISVKLKKFLMAMSLNIKDIETIENVRIIIKIKIK